MISDKQIKKFNKILREITILEQRNKLSSKIIQCYYLSYQAEVIDNNNAIIALKKKARNLYITNSIKIINDK